MTRIEQIFADFTQYFNLISDYQSNLRHLCTKFLRSIDSLPLELNT